METAGSSEIGRARRHPRHPRFLRARRLRTIVYLNDRPVRRWSAEEIGFMQEVAERTRQVIERGEAEAGL
ncbi:hypothetical protein [Caulobacter sp. FWC2]|jgi:GAF domain-containing protein|uniref:hypothetical protein n=1 Tax=Caulobacter sp. FWC2 TaxID=69664 RepID=UPI000C15E0DA|nr:hypothetical protein [Caulobacter sp. FWC2]PIB89939.1 hypothetical protein CSW62_25190 [Caulobacter sp. FWC2]